MSGEESGMENALVTLSDLVSRADPDSPIRVGVVNALQRSVLETAREAARLGLADPVLIGPPAEVAALGASMGWELDADGIVPADSESQAARRGVELVRAGRVGALMKGHIHTDTFVRALLDSEGGLREPGRRVSHVFVVDVPDCPRLLAITDAAVNIAPDLNAKAQILQNAIELMQMLGLERPRAAAISAVENVNPAIASTLDAACLTLMARRGQITGAEVDGPLAFDNAVSERAAREKGIDSPVAGRADILLVPDLVSGNILAKNLEYHAGATAAGVLVGLAAPVVLSSRADPPKARLAGLAVARLMYRAGVRMTPVRREEVDGSFGCAPQPEEACCPVEAHR